MSNSKKKRIGIIGAGPAGLTAAYLISKDNRFEVDLYEASKEVGGMCKTLKLWDHKVDIGPHRFFSDNREINELWLEVVGKDYEMVDRLTRIYYNKKFFLYPIKLFDVLKTLRLIEAFKCGMSYFKELVFPSPQEDTFESWVVGKFGRHLYEIFFKSYTEKLWGISCTELSADFAKQRIKKLSLLGAFKSALVGNRGNKHKTLVDRFAYPEGGTGQVYHKMAERLKENGGRIFLNNPVNAVVPSRDRVIVMTADGREYIYDHVISSMPLTKLVMNIPGVPSEIYECATKLSFRNTTIVYQRISTTESFKDNWLYVHDNSLRLGRITNFANWSDSLGDWSNETILALEYWSNNNDTLWNMSDDELINLGKSEMVKTGLIKKSEIIDGTVLKIPKSYPIYSREYRKYLQPIEEYLSKYESITAIGRNGSFKYNNQDHSIMMGILVADNIVNKKKHNLWNINTDFSSYQESAIITESGLE